METEPIRLADQISGKHRAWVSRDIAIVVIVSLGFCFCLQLLTMIICATAKNVYIMTLIPDTGSIPEATLPGETELWEGLIIVMRATWAQSILVVAGVWMFRRPWASLSILRCRFGEEDGAHLSDASYRQAVRFWMRPIALFVAAANFDDLGNMVIANYHVLSSMDYPPTHLFWIVLSVTTSLCLLALYIISFLRPDWLARMAGRERKTA